MWRVVGSVIYRLSFIHSSSSKLLLQSHLLHLVILFLEYRLEDFFLDLLLDCLSNVLYKDLPVQILQQELLLFSEGDIQNHASIWMMIVVDHHLTVQANVWHPWHLTSLAVAATQTESFSLPVRPEGLAKLKQNIKLHWYHQDLSDQDKL